MPLSSCIVVFPPNIFLSPIIILYCYLVIYSYIYFTTINPGKIDGFFRKAAYVKQSKAS